MQTERNKQTKTDKQTNKQTNCGGPQTAYSALRENKRLCIRPSNCIQVVVITDPATVNGLLKPGPNYLPKARPIKSVLQRVGLSRDCLSCPHLCSTALMNPVSF